MNNVYIVRRGWDCQDCDPQIKKVFLHRKDAEKFIEKDVSKELEKAGKMWSEVRLSKKGPDRWVIDVKTDCPWLQDEVWLLEEHLVHDSNE